MMKSCLFVAAALAAAVDASTTVAVLELGKGGAVRRTTSKRSETSVSGVASFWSNLHDTGRKLQHAGMTVVPDLFNKADSGIVLGLMGSGLDLSAMPNLSGLVENEGDHVVGHMTLQGANGASLLNKAGSVETVAPSSLSSVAKSSKKGLSALSVVVDEDDASIVDKEVSALIQAMHKDAMDAGKTVILHLVVEEQEDASRRRRLARRLEDQQEEGGQDEEDQNQDQNQEGENANGNANNGYYGYGYYNAYGEWVTPYKTMFQIQYFNIVLWTSIGLVIALSFTVYLMINMPLMTDTLLFGESAKAIGD
jgi:hypothetical protein